MRSGVGGSVRCGRRRVAHGVLLLGGRSCGGPLPLFSGPRHRPGSPVGATATRCESRRGMPALAAEPCEAKSIRAAWKSHNADASARTPQCRTHRLAHLAVNTRKSAHTVRRTRTPWTVCALAPVCAQTLRTRTAAKIGRPRKGEKSGGPEQPGQLDAASEDHEVVELSPDSPASVPPGHLRRRCETQHPDGLPQARLSRRLRTFVSASQRPAHGKRARTTKQTHARSKALDVTTPRCSAASAAMRDAIGPLTIPVWTTATLGSTTAPIALAPSTASWTVRPPRLREWLSSTRVTCTCRGSAAKIGSPCRTSALW